jgi:hypothetical protein
MEIIKERLRLSYTLQATTENVTYQNSEVKLREKVHLTAKHLSHGTPISKSRLKTELRSVGLQYSSGSAEPWLFPAAMLDILTTMPALLTDSRRFPEEVHIVMCNAI